MERGGRTGGRTGGVRGIKGREKEREGVQCETERVRWRRKMITDLARNQTGSHALGPYTYTAHSESMQGGRRIHIRRNRCRSKCVLKLTNDAVEHEVSCVVGGQLVVGTENPQLGRVFKRMLSIAQFVQETAQSLCVCVCV